MENASWDLPTRNTCVFARLALQEETVKPVKQSKCFIHNNFLSAIEILCEFLNVTTRSGESFKLFQHIERELTIFYSKS